MLKYHKTSKDEFFSEIGNIWDFMPFFRRFCRLCDAALRTDGAAASACEDRGRPHAQPARAAAPRLPTCPALHLGQSHAGRVL